VVYLIKPNISISLPEKPEVAQSGGGWPLYPDNVENWAWKKQIFTEEELNTIIEIGESSLLSKATTFGEQSDKNRNSYVSFLYPNDFTKFIYERVTSAINEINDMFFRFDLSSMNEGLQYTSYSAPTEHYDWHIDRGYLIQPRKLSMSLLLSDPSEYRGGDLELMFGRVAVKVPREKGIAVFFPSYVLHRVRKVTSGTRRSLVVWVAGPPFK
jgi:PKHD-type hydroxylase